ncbi:hypothetical protein J6590_096636 [Homalodisca vitripennis]|nr:hypothetical protein J6590_096636 [Homalodisca vitripennis]
MDSQRNASGWMHGYENDTELVGYVPYSERQETYIVPVVFAIIFLVGVLGNGTLVFIFARHRTMRNVPNTYIFSLALGDLLVIVSCVPFTSTLYTIESWPWGELICKLSEATKDVSIGVSVFTLSALSAERYCAIVNPIRSHISSKPLTIITAVLIWIMSLILALPAAIFSNVQSVDVQDNHTILYCSLFPSFYVLMARHLMLSTRTLPGEHNPCKSQSNQIQARKKVAKMVLAFGIIFIMCFLPYHIFMLWFHFYPSSHDDYDGFWHVFRIVGFGLSYINSCINPTAVYFVSKAFRKHFNQYLFCCVRPTNEIGENTLSHLNSSTFRRHNSVMTSHYSISHSDKS